MSLQLLTLEDELSRVALAPEIGGSLVNWTLRANGRPLLRPSVEDRLDGVTPRQLACYPLAPWSNRIAEGGFDNPDGWLALAPNTPHDPYPIHGSAWQRPWRAIECLSRQALLRLDSHEPFPYRAELRVQLIDGSLNLTLSVTHQGEHPAWYGLGLHPYFPRGAQTQLQASAQQVWIGSADRLPDHQEDIPPTWRFDQLRALPDERIDHAFSGWDGRFRLLEPEAGYQLEGRASGCDHFLFYTPPQQDFFCIEPVTHPINAHHLPGRPGLKLLARGETMKMGLTLTYREVG